MMGSGTGTGTITWKITSVAVLESLPLQYRINIEETRSLEHYTEPSVIFIDSNGNSQPSSNDTTYFPPLITINDLVIKGTDGVNGLSFENDDCWSFIHDKNGSGVDSLVIVTDTSFSFSDNAFEYPAIIVNPSPCLNISESYIAVLHKRPSHPIQLPIYNSYYYILADELGPVGYHSESSPLMQQGYQEDWTLVSTNVGGITQTFKLKVKENAFLINKFIAYSPTDNQITINLKRRDNLRLEYSDLSGKTRQLLTPSLFSTGSHTINIPELFRGRVGILTLKGEYVFERIKVVQ